MNLGKISPQRIKAEEAAAILKTPAREQTLKTPATDWFTNKPLAITKEHSAPNKTPLDDYKSSILTASVLNNARFKKVLSDVAVSSLTQENYLLTAPAKQEVREPGFFCGAFSRLKSNPSPESQSAENRSKPASQQSTPNKKSSFFDWLFKPNLTRHQSTTPAAEEEKNPEFSYRQDSDEEAKRTLLPKLKHAKSDAVTDHLMASKQQLEIQNNNRLVYLLNGIKEQISQDFSEICELEAKHEQVNQRLPTAKQINYLSNTRYLNNQQHQEFDKIYKLSNELITNQLADPEASAVSKTLCKENAKVFFLGRISSLAQKHNKTLQPKIDELLNLTDDSSLSFTAALIPSAREELKDLIWKQGYYLENDLANCSAQLQQAELALTKRPR